MPWTIKLQYMEVLSMFNTGSRLRVFLSLRKVRIEILLLAIIIFLGLQAGAYAQAVFQTGSIPVTAVSSTDNTAQAGAVVFTVFSGTSVAGTITITYPMPITCPFSAVTLAGTGGFAGGVTINAGSSNAGGVLIINVPAGGSYGNTITVSGVRLGVAGSSVSGPIYTNFTLTGNAILVGQTSALVINFVTAGIASLSGTPGLINAVTGAVLISPIVGAKEGYLDGFRTQGSGDTTSVLVRFSLAQAPPPGVTVRFPAEAIVGGRRWQTTDAYGYVVNLPMDVTYSTYPLPVYYKSVDQNDPISIETLSVPITVIVSSSALPLSPTTISYTASLAPTGPAFDSYPSYPTVVLAPIPRFVASEVGPATLFSIVAGGVQPSLALPINPYGGTNEYKFPDASTNLYNYKTTYPPLANPPANPVDLVVTPIFITQSDLTALLGGQFTGATLVPYDGTGGYGVLFRTSCQEHTSGNPVPCPELGVIDFKTSWYSPPGQNISQPAFLKLPGGSGTWVNILTDFSATRYDPTGSGRACCRYSDFVFVDNITGTPPAITINTPQDRAAYMLGQHIPAAYSCSGSAVTSCIGTVPNGSLIDTSSVGTKPFEANANVTSGPAADRVVMYYVTKFGLRLRYDPSLPVPSGWPMLIMLELNDASGKNVTSSQIKLKAANIVRASSTAGSMPQPSYFAKSCKDFLYIPLLGGKGWYVFLLDTRGLSAGSYVLQFTVSTDAGSTYPAPFKIR
jgi:hypothetical protein